MRWIISKEFERIIESNFDSIDTVAVVGGSPNDPEIKWLEEKFPDAKFTFLGVEEIPNREFIPFDLNSDQNTQLLFDVVHCAQVLEHVWDVKQAVANLMKICSNQGVVWINCPASCRAHASPYYFSAGYQADLLCNLARLYGSTMHEYGQVGSRRSYFYEHTLRRWPDKDEFSNPLIFMTSGRRGKVRAFFRWVKYFPQRVLASFYSPEITSSPEFATQTWVALRKSDH